MNTSRNAHPEKIRLFWSPEMEAKFDAAYETVLQQWPVPYEELSIPTRFGETRVIASGPKDAAPVVLFHPAGGSATVWYRNVGPLSQHYRTYAVDIVGDLNKSVLTRPIHSRQDYVAWMADLFNGLQIERAYLVGNSNGGFLTLNAALYLPERVKKVVLISPAATFAPIWAMYWHEIIIGNIIASLIRSERLVQKEYAWVWQGFPKDASYAQLSAIAHLAGYPRYRPTHNPPPSVFSDEELRQIRTPVLLLIGDHEVIYKPERVIRRATRLVTGLKAEIVPHANHVAEYTAASVVNAKILAFFRDP